MDVVVLISHVGVVGVYIGIGALWYSSGVFGQVWARAHDIDRSHPLVEARLRRTAPVAYVQLVTAVSVIVSILATLINLLDARSLYESALLAVAIWCGFVAPVGFMNTLFTLRGLTHVFIDAGYHLVGMVTSAILLSRLI